MFPVSSALLTNNVETSNTTKNLDSVTNLKACRVCLAMSVKMYHMSEHKLSVMYERATGVGINTEDMLPKMLCWECVARLSSAHNFLEKASKTHWLLTKKLKYSKIVTMSDIESIDRTQHQLESTLGFKYYKENYSDVYIVEESDKSYEHQFNNDNCNYCEEREVEYCESNDIDLNNVEEPIIIAEGNITNEKDPIKREYLDTNEEQNLAKLDANYYKGKVFSDELNYQNLETQIHVSIKECLSDEEVIDNVSTEMSNEENKLLEAWELMEERKQSQNIQQRNWRSEALPHCKEPRVVLEDIMIILSKHNTQDTFKQLGDTAQSSKDSLCHPPIMKDIWIKKNNIVEKITLNTDTIKGNYLQTTFKNINVCNPVSAGHIPRVRTGTTNTIEDATKSSKKLSCDICGKQFQFKTALIRHIRKHSLMYSCTYCSYKSAYKSRLSAHINAKHTKTKGYACSYCSYTAYLKVHLTTHINAKHTKTNVYNCSHCSYKSAYKSNLSAHINAKHTKTKGYDCSYCSYTAYLKVHLTAHVNAKHTKTNAYNCSFCSYKTYDKSTLAKHVNAIHTKAIVYNCSLCSYKAYRKHHLAGHVTAKHNRTIVNKCSYCIYKAYDKRTLNSHVNTKHTKTNVYNCSHCSYKSAYKNSLSAHINAKHTKTNVYNCSHCSYKSAYKSSLSAHINAKHTKTNVYNCSHCSYKSYRKCLLTRHINAKHTKTNVYNCSHCSYKSYRKCLLTRHINAKHTKTNVYNCSHCSYKSAYKSNLSAHINAKHT